jgi:pimeloyl-ACP methyl ester carboxylesterase
VTTQQEVKFVSAGLTLEGTLTLPDAPKPCPAVLLIVGSGIVDRDENAKQLPIDVMRQLAMRLAENGVGSLRYDKRGVGASEGEFWTAGLNDNVDDAAAALGCLRSQPGVDPESVYVCGHSEGATISIRLAGRHEPIAGAILLAGVGRLAEEALLWQGEQVVPGMTGFNKWLIGALHVDIRKSQLKAFAKIKKSTKDSYRVQGIKRINAKWMREFLAYDPAADLARIEVPVLGITGSKDIQVDPADLDLMAALIPTEFEPHVVPDVTHLLRADDSAIPTVNTYKAQIQEPVDERVLELVTDWLGRRDSSAAGDSYAAARSVSAPIDTTLPGDGGLVANVSAAASTQSPAAMA